MNNNTNNLIITSYINIIKYSGPIGVYLLIRPILYFFISRKRELSQVEIIDSSALFQIGYIFIGLILCLITIKENNKYIYNIFKRPLFFLWIYILLCLLSSLWSGIPLRTFWEGFSCASTLLLILLIAENYKGTLKDYIDYTILYTLLSAVLTASRRYIIYGSRDFSISGFHGAGDYSIGSILLIVLFLGRKRFPKYLLLSITILATSSKIFLSTIISSLIMAFLLPSKQRILTILFIIVIIILIFSFFIQVIISFVFYGKSEEEIYTGTGRIYIWQEYWQIAMIKPIFGWGFYAGEHFLSKDSEYNINSAHNWFLAALVGTGLVGAFILSLFFIDLIYYPLQYTIIENWRIIFVGSSIMCFIIGLFGPSIGSNVEETWISQALVASIILHGTKRYKLT